MNTVTLVARKVYNSLPSLPKLKNIFKQTSRIGEKIHLENFEAQIMLSMCLFIVKSEPKYVYEPYALKKYVRSLQR